VPNTAFRGLCPGRTDAIRVVATSRFARGFLGISSFSSSQGLAACACAVRGGERAPNEKNKRTPMRLAVSWCLCCDIRGWMTADTNSEQPSVRESSATARHLHPKDTGWVRCHPKFERKQSQKAQALQPTPGEPLQGRGVCELIGWVAAALSDPNCPPHKARKFGRRFFFGVRLVAGDQRERLLYGRSPRKEGTHLGSWRYSLHRPSRAIGVQSSPEQCFTGWIRGTGQ